MPFPIRGGEVRAIGCGCERHPTPITKEDVLAEMKAEDLRELVGDVMARWYVEHHVFDWSCQLKLDGHTLVRGDDCCPKCKESDDAK